VRIHGILVECQVRNTLMKTLLNKYEPLNLRTMKTKSIVLSLMSAMIMVMMSACTDPPKFIIVDVNNVGETSAEISWETTDDEYTSVNLFITNESDAGPYVKDIRIDGIQTKSILIDDLTGLTDYSLSLKLLNGEEPLDEEAKIFRTSYSAEKFEMVTRDDYTLRGIMYYLSSWTEKVPGIIMMHGLTETMHPWMKSETMDALITEGYACMAFYFRGHGNSDGFDTDLFGGPDAGLYLGNDVETSIIHILTDDRVDPDKIGMMGGSMGGTASIIGNMFPEVKSSVALSAVWTQYYWESFRNAFPELDTCHLCSIYFIAGENDIHDNEWGHFDSGKMAQDCYDISGDPKNIWILPGSKLHGSSLATYPGVIDTTVNWFKKTLPSPYNK